MRRSGAVDGSVEVEIVESDDDGDGDGDDGRASGGNPHQRPAWEGDRARRQMLRRVGVGSVVTPTAADRSGTSRAWWDRWRTRCARCGGCRPPRWSRGTTPVSYTHLRAHETRH